MESGFLVSDNSEMLGATCLYSYKETLDGAYNDMVKLGNAAHLFLFVAFVVVLHLVDFIAPHHLALEGICVCHSANFLFPKNMISSQLSLKIFLLSF